MQHKTLIVVLETDDLIRELLERWLGEAGYAVAVRDGLEAVRGPLHEGVPALIIVDLPSPRAAKILIRTLEEAYEAPILALSARFRRGLGSSRDVAGQLGVRAVLPKPFLRDELLRLVSESIDT